MDFLTASLTLFGPFLFGYACVRAGFLPRRWSKPIQRASVLLLAPPVGFLALWSLDVRSAEIAGVPLVAVVLCLSGMGLAFPLARLLGLPRAGTGAFVVSAGWSNTWLMGGYLAFLLFGQQGYALAALYNLLNPILTYVIGFTVASSFSPARASVSIGATLRDSFRDPVTILPSLGVLAGLGANLAFGTAGAWLGVVNAWLIPIFTIASMFAVGMSMTFRRTREYLRPILAQALIKYVAWPAVTLIVLFLIGGSLWYDTVTFRVLMLLAFMPVAMQSMLLANLFDLDIDLVNAVWLVTNLFSLLTVPILVMALRL